MESERGTFWLYRVKHHLNRITRLTPLIEEDDCPLKGYFGGGGIRPRLIIGMLLTGLSVGWVGGFNSRWLLDLIFAPRDAHSVPRPTKTGETAIDAIVDQIIKVESNGDPNLKNKRSSAVGLGQFLNETWLDLIRTHRPDLAREHSEGEILELRQDANIAREITVRFTEQNAG